MTDNMLAAKNLIFGRCYQVSYHLQLFSENPSNTPENINIFLNPRLNQLTLRDHSFSNNGSDL